MKEWAIPLFCCCAGGNLGLWLLARSENEAKEGNREVLPSRHISQLRRWCNDGFHYLVETDNPVVQILYLTLMLGGYGSFIVKGYPLLPTESVSTSAKWISMFLVLCCLGLFVVCCVADPGYLNEERCAQTGLSLLYDRHLYPADKQCPTCGVTKIPRSKHCRLCNLCVARVCFAGLTTIAFGLGIAWLFRLLQDIVRERHLWGAAVYDRKLKEIRSMTSWLLLRYVIGHYTAVSFLLLCCAVFFAVLLVFTAYHLHQVIVADLTTNESIKLRRLRAVASKDATSKIETIAGSQRAYNRPIRISEIVREVLFPAACGPHTGCINTKKDE